MSTAEQSTEFTLPEVYEGMDEVFSGNPELKIRDIIIHYETHLEYLQAGYYQAAPEVIEASIRSITAALLEADATDPSNSQEVFQVEIKHVALMNELRELGPSELYKQYKNFSA